MEEIESKDKILRLGLSKKDLNGYEDESYLLFAYNKS